MNRSLNLVSGSSSRPVYGTETGGLHAAVTAHKTNYDKGPGHIPGDVATCFTVA